MLKGKIRMFKAVIKGKSGSVRSDITLDDPGPKLIGLDVPNIREDILSAAVFSRLAYLPANKFWDLLCQIYSKLPDHEFVSLKNIEFWPYWKHPDHNRQFVEPDIFLQFDIGDPKLSVDLIVEVKRFANWTSQSAQQHIDQISSYFADEDNLDRGDELYFLALGGLGNEPRSQIKSLRENVIDGLPGDQKPGFSGLHIDGASWAMLSNAISQCRSDWSITNKCLLDDLTEILNYAGFKKRSYFADCPALEVFNFEPNALNSIYKMGK